MIVGFCGKMGSGKDTAGSYLVENHGFKRVSFADLLKKSAASCFGIDPELWEKLKNNPSARVRIETSSFPGARDIKTVANISVREFLQYYGTEGHRDHFGDDFWVEYALEGVDEHGDYVITDVRFENEARAIKDLGGVIVEILRDTPRGEDHVSEAGIRDGYIDIVIENYKSLDFLHKQVFALIQMERSARGSRHPIAL